MSRFRDLFRLAAELGVPVTLGPHHCAEIAAEWPEVPAEQLLGVAEMAAKLYCSEPTVRRRCAAGQIPGATLRGHRWTIRASDLDGYITAIVARTQTPGLRVVG